MLVRNIAQIITDNYGSLVEESAWEKPIAWSFLITLFIVVPASIGVILSFVTIIWSGLITSLATVLGVLTGFSINALVLLTRHSEKDSYELENTVVKRTREYTLYSVLVGISLLFVLFIGLVLANGNISPNELILQAGSAVIYSWVVHYFITLSVIMHRFHSIINGGAINNSS